MLWTTQFKMNRDHFCAVSILTICLFSLFHLSTCITNLHDATTTFRPLEVAEECFPQVDYEPRCKFAISNNASNTLKTECIRNSIPIPALRIQGEFNVLRITCTASYALDFIYYGIQPTEAMFIDWTKEIHPHESLSNQNYTVEVKVYSVQALFDFYNNPSNSYYEYPNENLPLQTIHDYSRSGNYTFSGIFNKTLGTSFYLFLEDTAKPSFLRNSHTVSMKPSNEKLLIPCLPSHYDTRVTVEGPAGPLWSTSWNPIEGYILNTGGNSIDLKYGNYTCQLYSGESQVDTLMFNFNANAKMHFFGLEDFDQKSGGDIDITGENTVFPGTPFVDFIYPLCKTQDPDSEVDFDRLKLISIPAHNFGYMRLVQQFALPKFANKSYTAKIIQGREHWDPLVRQIRQPNGENLRMGTVYCSTGDGKKIADFGSSIRGRFIPFNFGLDWAMFNRRDSDILVHFGIEPYNHTGPLYVDTEVVFVCRVNIPVLVKPVVWYTKMDNGSLIQVAIDYNLHEDMSIQSIKILNGTKELLCVSSYWYSDFWRNISYAVKPKAAVKPQILELQNEYKLTSGSVNRNIRCIASGIPEPDIYFEKNGKRVDGVTKSRDSAILLFSKVERAHAGTYTCVAKNVYETTKQFSVVLEDEFSGQDLTLIITIPLIVFILTALGALIYIKFFRPEKTGLTRQEVEDFVKGLKPEQAQMTAEGNEYTHEFAVMRPYVKEYEVPTNRFKIDESKVLGKGAFGLVLEGTVDGTRVAVKTIQRNADKQYLKALLSELKIMIHLGHHDNLISVVGAHTKDLRRGFVYVFVKYIPLGNMQAYLRKNNELFDPTMTSDVNVMSNRFGPMQLMQWSRQIACGMEYLGSKNVIHGDLAARNILLDENKIVKITDFGLSRQLYDYNDYIKKQQEPLPWRWMALESLKYMSFSKQSDIWSYAVTIWEVFSLGEVPYPGYSWNLDFVDNLEKGLRMGRPKHGSVEMFGMMCECWHPDPLKRHSFNRLIEIIDTLMDKDKETAATSPP